MMPSPIAEPAPNPGLTPHRLNHAAWVTHDVAATADFYTRIMGMGLASTVYEDTVPSTGDAFPYFHIFFRMQDGATIAFFEAPGLPERAQISHPAYGLFDHIALQATDRQEVLGWRDWLISNDVDIVGPTDHKGLIFSIYFYDPNGLRLEITTPLTREWNRLTDQGRRDLEMWCDAKKKATAEQRNVADAMVDVIREARMRYGGHDA